MTRVPQTAPFGSWSSPITADVVSAGGVSLLGVTANDDGVWWLEGRPVEGGRVVLVHDRTGDVTPDGFSVRTRVHEYGGGAFLVSGTTVWFTNFADQRLYRQELGGAPVAITPEPERAAALRYADLRLAPDGSTIYCVRESHPAGGEAVNEIVALPADGSGDPRVVASGHDFYSSPRPSPDGKRIAWVSWDHPNMPWDSTSLWVADLGGEAQLVAGAARESAIQPEWGPDGALYYISDETGWWNLYRDGKNLTPVDAEIGGPQWAFGASHYAFLSDDRIAVLVRSEGLDRLAIVPGADVALEQTSLSSLHAHGDTLYLIGASATRAPAVLEVDPSSARADVLRSGRDAEIDAGYLSAPRAIEFPTTGGLTAHALFYPPANRDYVGGDGELPPLIVISHGGPTGATSSQLSPAIQFWTSRGFAVVDVNYGGSTGYGRAYRERLKGEWGVVDVDDCVAAARWLAERGEADGSRMVIRGGSAGGYTTLCALVFRDVFAAGASYFGVADAEALARDTHKFESRYLDGLIGPYPADVERYRERSPIHFVDRISSPVIFFQGLEDEIVPPAQAESMVAALKAKGLPHAYHAFEGEQHGFRRAENVKRTLEAELEFYGEVLGFTPS